MPLAEDINTYLNYFRDRLLEIRRIDTFLYRKTLYVTMLDCLSRAAFPQMHRNRIRFVTFIDSCSSWFDRNRISIPQLKLSLEELNNITGRLYQFVSARLGGWPEGAIIRPEMDFTIDDIRSLMIEQEKSCVERSIYSELLYTYRNHLVHEFREPGYGMEFSDDPSSPYYHSRTHLTLGDSWELVFPETFLYRLCENCITGLETYFYRHHISPYDAYQFGTFWSHHSPRS